MFFLSRLLKKPNRRSILWETIKGSIIYREPPQAAHPQRIGAVPQPAALPAVLAGAAAHQGILRHARSAGSGPCLAAGDSPRHVPTGRQKANRPGIVFIWVCNYHPLPFSLTLIVHVFAREGAILAPTLHSSRLASTAEVGNIVFRTCLPYT